MGIALVVFLANVDVKLVKDSNGKYGFINKTIKGTY